jgi:hypothetical protein
VWRRWLAILAVASALIAGLFGLELATHPPINQQHHNQANTEHRAEQSGANPQETFWERTAHDPIAVFNLLLVGFTGVLAFSTIGLWIATVRLWRASETHAGHMEESVKAANRAAEVAEQTVKTMEDTAVRQLRAYVGLSTSEMSALSPGQPLAVELRIRNTGQTPAYNVSCYFRMQFAPYPFPREWMEELPIGPRVASTLAANAEFMTEQRFHRALAEAEIAAIHGGEAAVYVFGDVRYIDVFDKPRRTKFAVMYGGAAKSVSSRLAFYKDGNEAT